MKRRDIVQYGESSTHFITRRFVWETEAFHHGSLSVSVQSLHAFAQLWMFERARS